MTNKIIEIKGARVHNLKSVDVNIPRNKLVVVSGVSGSGKSSLVMDTLYAEGQRRYVESLSSYARQFLNRMKKPEVDYIKGICPAIALEQRVGSKNARSTVGSMTEIYDYLRVLFARIGVTYSPVSGKVVQRHQVSDVVDFILSRDANSRVILLTTLNKHYPERNIRTHLELLLQRGYNRIEVEGEPWKIEDYLDKTKKSILTKKLEAVEEEMILVVIDRFSVRPGDEENTNRISDSVGIAFTEGGGACYVKEHETGKMSYFNNRFEMDGIEFEVPDPHLFNFNNPYGACKTCEGFGRVMGIDEHKVFPDHNLSVFDRAIAPWKGETARKYLDPLIDSAHHFDFPIHKPYKDLSEEEKNLLWTGNTYFRGLDQYFAKLKSKSYKIQNRIILSRFRGRTKCPDCKGKRLRPEALYVKIQGHHIADLTEKPIDQLYEFFQQLELEEDDAKIAKQLLYEIEVRLKAMNQLGLSYLHLDRISGTLSGGETQRIYLTKCLGSNLTSSLYILDEPSIGLHPRDSDQLISVLMDLKKLGNTVVVVEHEEEIIREADYLIDMGPLAGENGGEVVYQGELNGSVNGQASKSLTLSYLAGKEKIDLPLRRRTSNNEIVVEDAFMHNLKNISPRFKLGVLNVLTGVSGSGKSTLVHEILYPALNQHLENIHSGRRTGYKSISGELGLITSVEFVGQKAIGRSSRSNPATYVKAFDDIRNTFASQNLSKLRGYTAGSFSFNVEGGRCENCKGDGEIQIEMQFLSDVYLECEVCRGKRFKKEILEVKYKNKSIYEVLELTIEDALVFFEDRLEIVAKLEPLEKVGLGYLRLGQPSSTLSGGEAQRLKLAYFLGHENPKEHILFIFDEPTTGLHFHDIKKLLTAFNELIELGHTVLVVEHNMDIIKSADWVVDLGPEGGIDGGNIVAMGTPEELANVEASYTGQYLKEKLNN
ncbi:excinuclease ABC subunit UvrA [Membranicola marinus]|uniref:UvrABC system protein A n=1 Tax=Membranihabitans marinus TaxID=1227546 RepID=A0A953HTT0_9BACT|nr:excinuclease ABC subunit UvrA [Membranihabitans marinus]MBY5958295.1 excinuclease ABC subunit UvrA [Membranihabitans marinus]